MSIARSGEGFSGVRSGARSLFLIQEFMCISGHLRVLDSLCSQVSSANATGGLSANEKRLYSPVCPNRVYDKSASELGAIATFVINLRG